MQDVCHARVSAAGRPLIQLHWLELSWEVCCCLFCSHLHHDLTFASSAVAMTEACAAADTYWLVRLCVRDVTGAFALQLAPLPRPTHCVHVTYRQRTYKVTAISSSCYETNITQRELCHYPLDSYFIVDYSETAVVATLAAFTPTSTSSSPCQSLTSTTCPHGTTNSRV